MVVNTIGNISLSELDTFPLICYHFWELVPHTKPVTTEESTWLPRLSNLGGKRCGWEDPDPVMTVTGPCRSELPWNSLWNNPGSGLRRIKSYYGLGTTPENGEGLFKIPESVELSLWNNPSWNVDLTGRETYTGPDRKFRFRKHYRNKYLYGDF